MTAWSVSTAIRAFTPDGDTGRTRLIVQVGEGDYRAVYGVARSVGGLGMPAVVLLLTRPLEKDEPMEPGWASR
jgi:hypothetical protein